MEKYRFAEMIWYEIRDAARQDRVAVLPVATYDGDTPAAARRADSHVGARSIHARKSPCASGGTPGRACPEGPCHAGGSDSPCHASGAARPFPAPYPGP